MPRPRSRHLRRRRPVSRLYNVNGDSTESGRVEVATVSGDGRAIVTVANTGPVVPADEIEELFVPFRRLGSERTSPGDGLGLGLSIVKAIADAHGATVAVTPQASGGLHIEVGFPERAAEALEVPWQRAHLLSVSSALLRWSSARGGRTGWRR